MCFTLLETISLIPSCYLCRCPYQPLCGGISVTDLDQFFPLISVNMYTTVTGEELKLELEDIITVKNNTLTVTRVGDVFTIVFDDNLGMLSRRVNPAETENFSCTYYIVIFSMNSE